ncbi:MAG: ABC transporter substrate-binding protein [Acidimicrobiales bacterium]|nr:ABC transporter substrate-binding protein [Acidimicrobiales bacterium]
MSLVSSRSRWWRLLAILFVFSLLAAACGDDDDDDGAAGDDGGVETTDAGGDDASDDGGDAASDDSSDDASDDASDAASDDTADGAGEDEGADDSGTDGEMTPTPGGSATYLMFSEITSLDPLQLTNSGGSDGNRSIAIYGSLVRLNNATGEIEPFMAESLTPNDDFTVWTLVLKPGILFSDGEPYDAEAVKFNWERLRDTEGSVQAANTSSIVELNVIDDVTLEVVLENSDAAFDANVSRRLFAIGSPKAIEERGDEFATNPVGAGPFMLEDWVRDDRMVLVKNPNFFLADEGMPYLDEMILRVVNDEPQRFRTFDEGEAELMYTQQSATIADVREAGYGIYELLSEGGQNINFNTTRPPFDDPDVRRAFMMSVDLETLNTVVNNGGGIPARGMFNEESPYYVDAPWPTFDCDAAKTLWGELADANGGPISFVFGVFQGNSEVTVEAMQAMLIQCSDGNLEVEIEVNEAGTAVAKNFGNDFDAHNWGVQFFFDPLAGLRSNLMCDSPQNSTRYCNADFDAAMNEAASLPPAERGPAYEQVQQILAEDNPIFWIFRSQITTSYQDNIHGVELFEEGLLKFEQVWMDQ